MPYQGADDPQLVTDLRAALKRLSKTTLGDVSLSTRLTAIERYLIANPGLSRADALRQVIRAALNRLQAADQAGYAGLLEQRYFSGQSVYHLGKTYHLSERSIYYRLREAIVALAHALWTIEEARSASTLSPTVLNGASPAARHLPPPTYTQLFGIEGVLARLLARLSATGEHWLVSVEGMGGLGKTALAREAAGRLAETDRFADIVWVTAKQEFYTWRGLEPVEHPVLTFAELLDTIADQLQGDDLAPLPLAAKQERVRTLLRTRPYLVVVDNLETAVDCKALPSQLWELANPSKFLLTSRHRVEPCAGLSALPLDALSEADSLALLRHEGRLRGLHEVTQAGSEILRPILIATGGHPLAIKLAAGQLVSLPLSQVLASLEGTQPGADPFFRYLYRASWELLSEGAKYLLQHATLLPASGGGWEDLKAITGLSDRELAPAIGELTAHSLLQASGLEEKTYTLHRLTHHFVTGQDMAQAQLQEGVLRAGEYYRNYARQHRRDWATLARRQDHILRAMQLCAGLGTAGQRIAVECAQLLNTYMVRKGYWTTWEPYLDHALQAAGSLADEAAQADLWNRLGLLRIRQGELDAALALHLRAAGAFRRLGDDLNLARTLRLQGNVHYTRPDSAAALHCYYQAHDLLVLLEAPSELSHVYNNIANIHFSEADWAQALTYYEQALALLDPEQHRQHITTLLDNVGLLRWEMGYWRQAVAVLLQVLPMQQAADDRLGQVNTHHYLCRVYTDLASWGQARMQGQQALALRKALGSPRGLADIYTDLAAIHLRMDDEQGADSYLDLAEPLWREANQPGGLALVYLLRGDLHNRSGEWHRAQTAYRSASTLCESKIDRPRRLMALLGLALAQAKTGDWASARASMRQAKTLADELARPDLSIRVLWFQAALNPPQARCALEQVLSLCCESDAGNDRLNRLCRETQARLENLDSSLLPLYTTW